VSFQLYDANGYVSDLASNYGMAQLEGWSLQNPSKLLSEFLVLGYTKDPESLQKVIEVLLDNPMPADIKTTLEHLKNNLKRVDTVAIIKQ